jgi:hypothetical protein
VKPSQTSNDGARVPAACTLAPSEQPARVASFDALFAGTVRSIERPEPARLRLDLEPSPQAAGRAAELAVAETGCCSFFTFTLTAADGSLTLDVTVPARQVAVLDGLAGRAAAAAERSA